MSSDAFVFYDSVDSLLARISHSLRDSNLETKELSNEDLLELESLFGQPLLGRALNLVYSNTPIKLYRTPNSVLQLLEVPGSKIDVVYKIYPGINFCTCESYRYWVIKHRQQATCKHVLATQLAQPLGRIREEIVTDKAYIELKAELIKQRLRSVQASNTSTGEGSSKH
ncbi:zinc finger SWIM domain-containing protein 7-like isoform X1 [Topomyia yanbarensis]|uniref:zinc finger SWIM domain-containing protein 7-like isoform X1 n=1 Tax=Topomyia yanbarensis TaxID=2498891 RepID=UPI00273BDEE5|nr:zinc finger SWIM domain-containing protein 7-like isoform X1 [Topomyia yanbarensis]